jgi:predicted dithiol-disulfide oxidoreductase (DUF899 family)
VELPEVASGAEWRRARKELLAKEKEFTRQRDALNAQRRRLPMVEIDTGYVFEGPDGKASLLDLFDGRAQLIVHHFMFDPSWNGACRGCSTIADNIGHLAHLHARGTSLVAVSRAPLAKIGPFKVRMGWTFPWYSSYGSAFNYDFHVTMDDTVARMEYNYRTRAEHVQAGTACYFDSEQPFELPGLSCFLRDGDRVYHTYSTYSRGLEWPGGTHNYLDLTALGRQECWVRYHDEYGG